MSGRFYCGKHALNFPPDKGCPECQTASSLATPAGSVELPREDGYYWMKNIAGEEAVHNIKVIWRVVRVFQSAERGPKKRVARDGQSLFTAEYLAEWRGVEFHGPLIPPNKDSQTG